MWLMVSKWFISHYYPNIYFYCHHYNLFTTMWGPRTIAKLVQITSITRVYVYDTCNYSIHGVTNQRITGGPHIVVANSD